MFSTQNLGNAEAINVEIVDTLSTALDISSIVQTSTSHDAVFQIVEDSILIILYKDIYLPAEVQDQEGSNGFFSYKIKTVADIDINTQISNRAAIYFDFNDPVITNSVNSTLIDLLPQCILTKVKITERQLLRHYPNPITNTLIIETALTGDEKIALYNISGTRQEVGVSRSPDRVVLELDQLVPGMYLVKIDENVLRVFKE